MTQLKERAASLGYCLAMDWVVRNATMPNHMERAIERESARYRAALEENPVKAMREWLEEVRLQFGDKGVPTLAGRPDSPHTLAEAGIRSRDTLPLYRLILHEDFRDGLELNLRDSAGIRELHSVLHALAAINFPTGFNVVLLRSIMNRYEQDNFWAGLEDLRDHEGYTLLGRAAAAKSSGVIRMLLALAVSAESESLIDNQAIKPIVLALMNKEPGDFSAFLAVATTATFRISHEGYDLVGLATMLGCDYALQRLDQAFQAHVMGWAPDDARYAGGNTLLHLAVLSKSPAVVNYWLERTNLLEVENAFGFSPLTTVLSIPNSPHEIVMALVRAGGKLNPAHMDLAQALSGTELRAFLTSELHRLRTIAAFRDVEDRGEFTDPIEIHQLPVAEVHQERVFE